MATRCPSPTTIRAEPYLALKRDPRVKRFWAEAQAYGRRMRRAGRDRSV